MIVIMIDANNISSARQYEAANKRRKSYKMHGIGLKSAYALENQLTLYGRDAFWGSSKSFGHDEKLCLAHIVNHFRRT